MIEEIQKFIQNNSPDGGFLQSSFWKDFQKSFGRKSYSLTVDEDNEQIAYANIITHTLPFVGDYFYIPRGPIIKFPISNLAYRQAGFQFQNKSQTPNPKIQNFLMRLIKSSEENNIGWIRVEPNSDKELNLIKENLPERLRIQKSAVDMQPREILIEDISRSEEEILASMKQKTRYNIKLSQKRGVFVKVIPNFQSPISKSYVEDFLRLAKITAKRDKITPHPENYYRRMFETIPPEILKLYVAEYEGIIIAANIVLFFGKTATYMHGASANNHREVMAPYLLQWQAIKDAKRKGFSQYDFGGIKTRKLNGKNWKGITRFKSGFAPDIEPIEFPGCYDIILKPGKYNLYRILRKIKS